MDGQLKKLRKNIHDLSRSMDNAPYHGVNKDTIKGVNYAIVEILKGTDITLEEIIKKQA